MSGFPVPGGSCLVCYDLPAVNGYIRGFHLAQALITSQLQQMYQHGQRRLSLAVPYYQGGDPFALDSTDGKLKVQDRSNLMNLVELALSIGFGEFVVEMIPEWSASYANWQKPEVMGAEGVRKFQPLDYGQDFAFTIDVDRAMQSTGAFYHMDLIGEGADVEVCARMWSDWCDQKGGHANSLGFSMVPTQASIDNFPKMYANGTQPLALSVHCYNTDPNNPGEMTWDQWKQATASWPQGFVVGESLCGHAASDAMFANSPGRLFYRFVWPISSNTLDATVTQDCLTVNQQF